MESALSTNWPVLAACITFSLTIGVVLALKPCSPEVVIHTADSPVAPHPSTEIAPVPDVTVDLKNAVAIEKLQKICGALLKDRGTVRAAFDKKDEEIKTLQAQLSKMVNSRREKTLNAFNNRLLHEHHIQSLTKEVRKLKAERKPYFDKKDGEVQALQEQLARMEKSQRERTLIVFSNRLLMENQIQSLKKDVRKTKAERSVYFDKKDGEVKTLQEQLARMETWQHAKMLSAFTSRLVMENQIQSLKKEVRKMRAERKADGVKSKCEGKACQTEVEYSAEMRGMSEAAGEPVEMLPTVSSSEIGFMIESASSDDRKEVGETDEEDTAVLTLYECEAIEEPKAADECIVAEDVWEQNSIWEHFVAAREASGSGSGANDEGPMSANEPGTPRTPNCSFDEYLEAYLALTPSPSARSSLQASAGLSDLYLPRTTLVPYASIRKAEVRHTSTPTAVLSLARDTPFSTASPGICLHTPSPGKIHFRKDLPLVPGRLPLWPSGMPNFVQPLEMKGLYNPGRATKGIELKRKRNLNDENIGEY